MKKYLSSVFAILAFLFRIIVVLYDYKTNEFVFHIYYYTDLIKVGNDYYLSSMTAIMYAISFLILLLSIKKTNLRIASVVILLIAAVMEVSMFFVFIKMHVHDYHTLYSGIVVLISSVIVLFGYIFVLRKHNFKVVKYASAISFLLCFAFGVWTMYSQLSTNISIVLSFLLAFSSHFVWSVNTKDDTMCSIEE